MQGHVTPRQGGARGVEALASLWRGLVNGWVISQLMQLLGYFLSPRRRLSCNQQVTKVVSRLLSFFRPVFGLF